MFSCFCGKTKRWTLPPTPAPVSSTEQINSVVPMENGSKSSTASVESVEKYASSEEPDRRTGIVPRSINLDEVNKAEIVKHPKDPEDDKLIKEAFGKNEFMNKIVKGHLLQEVVDAMYNREIAAEEIVVREGEKGSHLYVSAKGKFQISIRGKGVVSSFDDVRVFGELAILYNAKRMATIRAVSAGRVWVLEGGTFQQLLAKLNIREQDERVTFLENVPILNTAGNEVLQQVSNLLEEEFFPTGTVIIRQGDRGDKFYIIRAGTVTITKNEEGVVGKFRKGQFFGELALLKEDCRQATVVADSPGVECLTLTRQHFIVHFGHIEDLPMCAPNSKRKPTTAELTEDEYADLDLLDFKIIGTLGVGGFGRVELVQHKKDTNLVFALKYLRKVDMVQQCQTEHVKSEALIQKSCRSMFIVRMYRTYRDNKYIYFLMEACLGGDLFNLMHYKQKSGRFEERDARFFAACILEAIAYLHNNEIIYRDLKPENMMIDKDGYIKLTDFGFAKKLGPRGKTYTFAGTPEYVAPEIVLNRGHNKATDYWAFGCFLFELLTGRTPFRTNDPSHMRTYNKILAGIDNVDFPSYISGKARNIIEKLCRPVPTERLGCQKNGVKDVKDHKWLLGYDWERLNEKKLPSPFKPRLKSNTDRSLIMDQFKKDKDIPPDENSGWDADF